jgi:Domain of unknown function (DUF4159)
MTRFARSLFYRNGSRRRGRLALLLLLGASLTGLVLAQYKTPREFDTYGTGAPAWTNSVEFQKDVFTFARVKYTVDGTYGFGHTDPDKRWLIDSPDSDLNFSFRLQQISSIKVNPDGKFIELSDKDLTDYPFIYIVEPGRLTFTDPEIDILKAYLLNGGFLMCDDFWGNIEWRNFSNEIRKVFPDRKLETLPLDHPIFQGVFQLKEVPQVAPEPLATESQYNGGFLRYRWDEREPHYQAIFDDKRRIMILVCHNTDLGDGWEREGENEYYFKQFSEKWAYPLGVNIIFYAMTH